MKLYEFIEQVNALKVLDTHTHLMGNALCAPNFWEIGEYFWFKRELQAAGYPKKPEELSEDKRVREYITAFHATRNTSMNWVVRNIFDRLYGIKIQDEKSIKAAMEAVAATASDSTWAKRVAEKLSLQKVVVNNEQHLDFTHLQNTSILIPRIDSYLYKWLRDMSQARQQQECSEMVLKELQELFAGYAACGCAGIMMALPPVNIKTHNSKASLRATGNTEDELIAFLLHKICREAENRGFFIQLFLGVESGWCDDRVPVNRTDRLVGLYGLFQTYHCQFEVVLASEINHMDAVQAARIFSNVHIGGLWWFSFRESIFKECMQKRFEALPPSCSSFVLSDARSMEWCFGKVMFIKRIMAEYLFERIQLGWIDAEEALRIAEEWLYYSAARRYKVL